MNYDETPPKSYIYASVNKGDPAISPYIKIQTDNVDETLALLRALYGEIIISCSEGDKRLALKMIDDVNLAITDTILAVMD